MMTHMILPLEESKSLSWGGGAGFVGKGGVGLIISKEFHSPTFNAVAVSGRKVVVGAGGRAASCINEQQGWRWVSKLNWWTAGRGQGKIRIGRLVLQPFNIADINDLCSWLVMILHRFDSFLSDIFLLCRIVLVHCALWSAACTVAVQRRVFNLSRGLQSPNKDTWHSIFGFNLWTISRK